jgi:hypothetical protein
VSEWVTPVVYIRRAPSPLCVTHISPQAAAKCQHVWSQELTCTILSCIIVMFITIYVYSGQHLNCSEKVSIETSVTSGSLQPGVPWEACIYIEGITFQWPPGSVFTSLLSFLWRKGLNLRCHYVVHASVCASLSMYQPTDRYSRNLVCTLCIWRSPQTLASKLPSVGNNKIAKARI